jgi:hypothetical protein
MSQQSDAEFESIDREGDTTPINLLDVDDANQLREQLDPATEQDTPGELPAT